MIQAEKGHNSPKLEEKKFVLKWHLDNNMQDCVPMLMQLVLILDCTSWANTRVKLHRKPFWIKLRTPNLFVS